MNGASKKGLLGLAAAVGLAVGLYTVADGFAQGMMGGGMMGGQPGWNTNQTTMMGCQPGAMGYQGMGPGMMGGQTGYQGMGPGMMGGHMGFSKLTTDTVAVDRYLADLKARLGIATDQETAWNAYAQAVKTQISTHTDVHNTMHGSVAQNPLERTGQHLTAMETMLGQNKAVFEAYRTLHAQLGAKQRAVADQLSWPCHG